MKKKSNSNTELETKLPKTEKKTKSIQKCRLHQLWCSKLEQTARFPGKNKEMPKLRKSRPFCKIVPIKGKTRPENKTYLSRIWSNQRSRTRLVTKQNTPNTKIGPFLKTNTQRQTTILYHNGVGQQPSNQI